MEKDTEKELDARKEAEVYAHALAARVSDELDALRFIKDTIDRNQGSINAKVARGVVYLSELIDSDVRFCAGVWKGVYGWKGEAHAQN